MPHDNVENRPRTLHTESLVIKDRFPKKMFFDLRENEHGRFVQITEKFGERRSFVVIPIEVINDVIAYLEKIESVEEAL